MSGFFYLATPYSAYVDSMGDCGARYAYAIARENAATLASDGFIVFSPILQTHPLTEEDPYLFDGFPHAHWMKFDAPFMEAAEALVVVKALGWKESKGIQQEIEIFARAGKPVIYMEPLTLPTELERGGRYDNLRIALTEKESRKNEQR